MSIENTPAAGAKTHGHSATGEPGTNRAEEIQALDLSADLSAEARRAKAEARRAKAERRILGLELCGDDALREMAIAELANDRLRFAPIHRLIQAEIEEEHARQVGVIRRAAIAASLRAREEFAAIDVAALLTELASAPFDDAEAELREAIAAWRALSSLANAPLSSPVYGGGGSPRSGETEGGREHGAESAEAETPSALLPPPARGKSPRATSPVNGGGKNGAPQPRSPVNGRRKKSAERASTVTLTRADRITPTEVRWLWEGWLAEGKLHLIAGHPGTGKTTIALSLAAALSRGLAFADGSRAPEGSTIIWSGEDDLSDTLIPRFLASGGNARRLFGVDHVKGAHGAQTRAFDPARDFPALSETAKSVADLKLVIVDPIVLAVRGDSHRNAETRRGLLPLLHLAERTGAAILGITHFAKRTQGRDPGERVMGSGAFNAMARCVWSTAMPARDGVPFRLVRTKSNLAPQGDGFEYTLVQRACLRRSEASASRRQAADAGPKPFSAQAIEWGEPLFGPGAALIEAIETKPKHNTVPWSEQKEAMAWLSERLAQGPVAVAELARESKAKGFAWRTMERAKKELKIVSAKTDGLHAGWTWVWPKTANDGEEEPDDEAGGLIGGLCERLYAKLKDG